jgi:hypothetical protein
LIELVITAKRFVFHNGKSLGLVSVEVPLAVFTQGILASTDDDLGSKNYIFLIDKKGERVIFRIPITHGT